MSLLRHTLEEERHERIPADGDPYGVPTGVVPRTTGYFQVIGPVTPKPADPISQAVDDWLLMERKARAWDKLQKLVDAAGPVLPVTIPGLAALLGVSHDPDQ